MKLPTIDAIDRFATNVMSSEDDGVKAYHRLAGDTARKIEESSEGRSRSYLKAIQGQQLLTAVSLAYPQLSTETMLRVAARIAERVSA